MSYLIFLKRLEDTDNSAARRALRREEEHVSVYEAYTKTLAAAAEAKGDAIPELDRKDPKGGSLKWSHWKQLPAMRCWPSRAQYRLPVPAQPGRGLQRPQPVHAGATFIIQKQSLLQEAVNIIDALHLSEQNADVQGDIYEYLLNQLSSAGRNRQFRTPRDIIRMMTRMVNPQIGERICDPTRGTLTRCCSV